MAEDPDGPESLLGVHGENQRGLARFYQFAIAQPQSRVDAKNTNIRCPYYVGLNNYIET